MNDNGRGTCFGQEYKNCDGYLQMVLYFKNKGL